MSSSVDKERSLRPNMGLTQSQAYNLFGLRMMKLLKGLAAELSNLPFFNCS